MTLRAARKPALAKATAGRQDLHPVTPVGAVALTGGGHLGPSTATVGRFDHSTAIADCRKQQMPLILVRLRHTNVPVSKDVSSTPAARRL